MMDGLALSLLFSWEDKHIRDYVIGVDFLCWGAYLEVYLGKGTPPWGRKGEDERAD